MNKIYCPSMYKSVHVDTDGYLTPCCLFVHPTDKKTKINQVNNISEVLFGEFKEYRDKLEQGIWPEGCNQCKFAEEEGRSSKRQQDMWIVESGLVKTPLEEVNLEYLQLKTGRLCNLRCTICSPACSTSIAAELLQAGKLSRETYDEYQKDIAWSYDINEYKKMNSEVGYFRIDIAGGEPLMNKVHFEWLDQLENPNNTQLLYNTNGTQTPSRKEINIWKKFRGIWIAVSIDSYGEKFENLRVGAKWDQVIQNLKYIQEEIINKEFNSATSNTSVVMTISKYNVKDVFEVYNILTKNINFNHKEPLHFNYLYYPEHLACHNMPKNELEEVIKLYDNNMLNLDVDSKMYQQSKSLRDSLVTFLENKTIDHHRPLEKDHR